MTITFHPYCWYRKQGGERTLFVRVTFRKQSRKIATTITVTQADLTRTGKVKSPAILNKYEDLVRQMRDAVSDLNAFALDAMTVDDVVRHIRKRMEGQREGAGLVRVVVERPDHFRDITKKDKVTFLSL